MVATKMARSSTGLPETRMRLRAGKGGVDWMPGLSSVENAELKVNSN